MYHTFSELPASKAKYLLRNVNRPLNDDAVNESSPLIYVRRWWLCAAQRVYAHWPLHCPGILPFRLLTDGPLAQCKAYEAQMNEQQNLIKFYERKLAALAEAGHTGPEVSAREGVLRVRLR